MNQGDEVFIAAMMLDDERRLQDLRVLSGKLVSVAPNGEREVEIVSPAGAQILRFPEKNVFQTAAAAEKKLLGFRLQRGRKELLSKVGGNRRFYPEVLLPHESVVFTGNPLRAGEPNVAFAAQTNAWGGAENAQKLLLLAGAIWDDIRNLMAMLELLAYSGDYSKKLIGKYVVVELQSLFACLRKLQKHDPNYQPLFQKLSQEIEGLKELGFRTIRDKIAAHRDSDLDIEQMVALWRRLTRYNVNKFLDIFGAHLSDLHQLYPDEIRSYFVSPRPAAGLHGSPPPAEDSDHDPTAYAPFDPPWRETASEKPVHDPKARTKKSRRRRKRTKRR